MAKSINYEVSYYSISQPPVILPLFDPNILLSTVLKHPQSILMVRDQVSHQYRIASKITVFLHSDFNVLRLQKRRQKNPRLNDSKHYQNSVYP
jgi:polysaccharide pyruvyl transferase WcaK-like protein